jgi:hypothetical protein
MRRMIECTSSVYERVLAHPKRAGVGIGAEVGVEP